MLVWSAPELLVDRDIVWFIDNTPAETALIKSASPTESMCRPALAVGMALLGLRARVWYEHVPSASNPADWLSRDGLRDRRVALRLARGEWQHLPAAEPPLLFSMSFQEICEQVSALGGRAP